MTEINVTTNTQARTQVNNLTAQFNTELSRFEEKYGHNLQPIESFGGGDINNGQAAAVRDSLWRIDREGAMGNRDWSRSEGQEAARHLGNAAARLASADRTLDSLQPDRTTSSPAEQRRERDFYNTDENGNLLYLNSNVNYGGFGQWGDMEIVSDKLNSVRYSISNAREYLD
jgi:uncharacterized membrane protein YccC